MRDKSVPATKICETTEAHCILPQQVLRGATLEVHFRILVRSSSLASELVLGRCTREFHCVAFIFGVGNSGFCTKAISSMLKSSNPFSATLTVWQITLGGGASCDPSSVGMSTRMLQAGTQFPDNGMSMTVGDTVSGQSRRLSASAYWPQGAARNSQLAHKVQFPVSSTLQAGVDSTGLGVDRMLLRDEKPAAPVALEAGLRVADVAPLRLTTVEYTHQARGLQESD